MVFSSLLFLYAFLPLFLGFYYAAPLRWRNAVALVFSVVFYAWGEPAFAAVLLGASLVVYLVSLGMDRLPAGAGGSRRALLVVGLGASLGLLVYCKYSNFFIQQLNDLLNWLLRHVASGRATAAFQEGRAYAWSSTGETFLLSGQPAVDPGLRLHGPLGWLQHGGVIWKRVMLPIGVSFFTFQKISYLMDVYRGTTKPARGLVNFLLYVMLFPQLIAGPIVRYHDIAAELEHRDHTLDRFLSGVWRFLLGLGRKVLVANPLGQVADTAFGHDIASLPMPHAWIGLLCYAFQIYFDFAGYSDMAIGLARMMGFEFMENFNRPYTARTVTEFWRRWHMSLTNFMRDYLYIPLGGNRAGAFRTGLNLWLVFLASGFWHGASWSFIAWGVYHGTLLTLEKAIGRERLERLPGLVGNALTFLLVLGGWLLFRSPTLAGAWAYAHRLLAWGSWPVAKPPPELVLSELISNRATAMLAVAAVISFLPDRFWQRFGWDDPLPAGVRGAWARTAFAATCLVLASAALAGQGYNPFIYQRF